jgi:hypothetical protein
VSNNDEKPLSATRLTLPMSGVVALTIMLLGLLGSTATGVWAMARSFSRIEQKLDAVSEPTLRVKFISRDEAGRYHRELERALQKSGLKVEFPPPRDPSDYTPSTP